jgi:hypothetical protein
MKGRVYLIRPFLWTLGVKQSFGKLGGALNI